MLEFTIKKTGEHKPTSTLKHSTFLVTCTHKIDLKKMTQVLSILGEVGQSIFMKEAYKEPTKIYIYEVDVELDSGD